MVERTSNKYPIIVKDILYSWLNILYSTITTDNNICPKQRRSIETIIYQLTVPAYVTLWPRSANSLRMRTTHEA